MARNKKTSESLFQFMNQLIALLLKNGQYRTMQHYQATLHSLMRFLDHLHGGDSSKPQDISLGKIDAEMIQSYEAYLKNVAKVCRNTSSFYLRILRAVYNKAVEQGLVTSLQHPNLFKNVYTGIDKTRKRAIGAETVMSIQQLDLSSTPMQEMAQYTFLVCLYLQGISFVDLAHLRKSDIHGGVLRYNRSKTGRPIYVKWDERMQEIVERYQHLTKDSPYLFPFLANAKNDERRLYHNAESRISYHLRKIGKKVGLDGNLTLYVARHSWATLARDLQVSVPVISECLGHDSVVTTQVYLGSIHTQEVFEANAKVLAFLSGKK